MGIAIFIRAVPFIMMRGVDKCSMPLNYGELTREELRALKRLAVEMCANYDGQYKECMILDGACYMNYGVAYTCSALCNYFKKAVLPLDPKLEALFNGDYSGAGQKNCVICGKPYHPSGRNRFCSDVCRAKSKRIQDRASKRKQREILGRMSENRGY